METPEPKRRAKYLSIVDNLRAEIGSGRYGPGARLPSEADLIRQFSVSRMTAVKAIRQLQQEGLLTRRPGSGSFAAATRSEEGRVFGLLIPDLGQTEIFEPICRGMMRSPCVKSHSLSWGHSPSTGKHNEDEAEYLCQQYIDQRVSGVFYAPLEFSERRREVNARILRALSKAGVAVILLDRDYLDYPGSSGYDLVGLNNRRAGFEVTEHLIRQGATRVAFFARENSAETVERRMGGYRDALFMHDLPISKSLLLRGDPTDGDLVEKALRSSPIDAIMCANDHTAALLMQTLLARGVRVPQDVRIAGIDDVKYASFLPIPLTTLHQPCDEIGMAAMSAMLERVNNPQLPARSILLNGYLVVRRSCGGGASA
jgi:DNA-binding LacI/PurR family transcriptional regulator